MAYELIKVSELPELTTPSDPNVLPIQDGDYLKRISFANLKDAAVGDMEGSLAAAYDPTATYAVGDYCIYEGQLYRCTTAIATAEAWTAGHWTVAVLTDDIASDLSTEASTRSTNDNALAADIAEALGDLAAVYSSSATYAVGDYCTKDGQLYRCTTAISTAEAWTAAHWSAVALGNDTRDLRSALSESTGNAIITGWVDNYFISTNGSTYNPNGAVFNANYRYVFVACSEGDAFTINGAGGGNPRLWAFADASNNVLEPKAGNDATATNLVITAPANATRLIINDKNKNKDSYYGKLLKDIVNEVKTVSDNNTEDLATYVVGTDTRFEEIDGGVYLDPDDFELGNITIGTNGWNYSSSSSRVRTKQGVTIHLNAGDVIRLTNYANARMYIGFKLDKNGTYGASGSWITSDYIATRTGEYVLLISNINETTLSSKFDLLNLLRIYRLNNTIVNGYLSNSAIRVVNHRGYNESAPENTIPAFKLSKKNGFNYVETDVWFTSDGIGVLLHDGTVDRTSNGTGNIWDMTYAEARTLDFGSWFSSDYTGTKIPSFEELLTLCKNIGLIPIVELKGGSESGTTESRIKSLVNLAFKHGMSERIVWCSYTVSYLGYVLEIDNTATVMGLKDTIDATFISSAKALENGSNTVIIAMDKGNVTSGILELVDASQLQFGVYVVNLTSQIDNLADEAVYVTTDYMPIDRIKIYQEILF